MKNLLIFVCFLLFLSSNILAKQKVVLVTGEWAPYTSKKMNGYGFFTEIVSAVFKESDFDVEYRFYPWLRCEHNLKKGIAYAAFPYKMTDERKKIFDFSDELANSKNKFFYLKKRIKSKIKWEKLEDLKPYAIGGTFGYWYKETFKEAGLSIDYGYTDKIGIMKLHAGRFDFLATNELVGWELIKTLFPEDLNKFATVKKPFSSDNLRLMISRTYPKAALITNRINKAINKIKAKGIYSQILIKYNLKE
ncbi:MAG: transporter substrate-binding domain-containing protein [Desulfobacterales bacterium]|nr:transporter substrate-binding domain-containing protein [Desulfobacterales bacterium]MCP4162075.1 transporter substrate-binding domain-containing protein [Deltaproteobacteria bacterium]